MRIGNLTDWPGFSRPPHRTASRLPYVDRGVVTAYGGDRPKTPRLLDVGLISAVRTRFYAFLCPGGPTSEPNGHLYRFRVHLVGPIPVAGAHPLANPMDKLMPSISW